MANTGYTMLVDSKTCTPYALPALTHPNVGTRSLTAKSRLADHFTTATLTVVDEILVSTGQY